MISMKKITNTVLGALLIALGVIFALNALEITDIDIFFDGWWTLFIIVPCLMGLFTERKKSGNLIGLAIGVLLLLGSWDIISFSVLWKLLVPVIIVMIGVKIIVSQSKKGK